MFAIASSYYVMLKLIFHALLKGLFHEQPYFVNFS